MALPIYDEMCGVIGKYDAWYLPGPHSGETQQEAVKRLTHYIARDLPEDGWDMLSKEAMDWHDAALDSIKAETAIALPDGYPKPVETRRRRSVDDDPPAATPPATETRRRRTIAEVDAPAAKPPEVDKPRSRLPTEWDAVRSTILAFKPDFAVDRGEKEGEIDHVKRLLQFFGKNITEAEFDAMPQVVIDYYERQADLGEKAKPFTAPVGLATFAGAAGGAPADTKPTPDAPKTRGRGRPPAEAKAPANGATDGGEPLGATTRILQFVAKNHTADAGKLKEMMHKPENGLTDIKDNTRAVIAANAVKLIAIAREAGLWAG